MLRTASLGAQTGTGVAPRPLAASEDGSTLYLARPNGLIPIASASLTAGAPLANRAFGSVEVGSTGLLYAAGARRPTCSTPTRARQTASPLRRRA